MKIIKSFCLILGVTSCISYAETNPGLPSLKGDDEKYFISLVMEIKSLNNKIYESKLKVDKYEAYVFNVETEEWKNNTDDLCLNEEYLNKGNNPINCYIQYAEPRVEKLKNDLKAIK